MLVAWLLLEVFLYAARRNNSPRENLSGKQNPVMYIMVEYLQSILVASKC